jgi:hypothetical protein
MQDHFSKSLSGKSRATRGLPAASSPSGPASETPLAGRTRVAQPSDWIDGHFRPVRRRFALAQYRRSQVTVPRLVAMRGAVGIEVSNLQMGRVPIGCQDRFPAEARDVRRAALVRALWVSVDDTGARRVGIRREPPWKRGSMPAVISLSGFR